MDGELPEVVLITTASVDGRVTLGSHQRLIDPPNRERWGSMSAGDPFPGRPADIDATVVLEGSGSFVDIDDQAPPVAGPDDTRARAVAGPSPPHGPEVVRGGRLSRTGRLDLHRRRDDDPARPRVRLHSRWISPAPA